MKRFLLSMAAGVLLAGVSPAQELSRPAPIDFVIDEAGVAARSHEQADELLLAQAQVPAPPQPSQAGAASNAPVTSQPPQQPGNALLRDKLQEMQSLYGAKDVGLNGAGAEIVLQPKRARNNFNISGDTRSIYTQLAAFFGIRVSFDESTPSKFIRFQLQDADFDTAMEVAGLMTRTFWVPLTPNEILVAADNDQKRRELERMVQETFYLRDATTPQEVNDVVNMLRTLLEIRFVTQQPGSSSITVRAPQRTIRTAELLLRNLSLSRPQVSLQVQVFEVNQSMLRSVGVQLPLQFQIFNIGSALIAALNSPSVQDQIAQLVAQGNLNPSDLSALAPLLGQFQNQLSSLLANPIATFGGGLTLFGVGVPPATLNFSSSRSQVRSLEDTILRASQGNAANLHIGTRYPVLTQSFSSGVSLPGNLGNLANLNALGAVPGFNYEDLGVTLKAKPQIHGSESVTLDVEIEIRTLGAETFNSIPVIQNRTYKGVIRVNDGEPAVMAGMLSKSEQKTLSGVPAIGTLPLFNRLLSNEVLNDSQTELVVVITPRIISAPPEATPVVVVGQ